MDLQDQLVLGQEKGRTLGEVPQTHGLKVSGLVQCCSRGLSTASQCQQSTPGTSQNESFKQPHKVVEVGVCWGMKFLVLQLSRTHG